LIFGECDTVIPQLILYQSEMIRGTNDVTVVKTKRCHHRVTVAFKNIQSLMKEPKAEIYEKEQFQEILWKTLQKITQKYPRPQEIVWNDFNMLLMTDPGLPMTLKYQDYQIQLRGDNFSLTEIYQKKDVMIKTLILPGFTRVTTYKEKELQESRVIQNGVERVLLTKEMRAIEIGRKITNTLLQLEISSKLNIHSIKKQNG
jgi:hypothetical protein